MNKETLRKILVAIMEDPALENPEGVFFLMKNRMLSVGLNVSDEEADEVFNSLQGLHQVAKSVDMYSCDREMGQPSPVHIVHNYLTIPEE